MLIFAGPGDNYGWVIKLKRELILNALPTELQDSTAPVPESG